MIVEPDPVQNAMMSFDEPSAVYNPDNNTFSISANVSWEPPLRVNGQITNYTVKIVCLRDYLILTTVSVDPSINSIVADLLVIPYEVYFTEVTVANGAGSAAANSSTVFSPQAGKGDPVFFVLPRRVSLYCSILVTSPFSPTLHRKT